jgi:hypothetical protein
MDVPNVARKEYQLVSVCPLLAVRRSSPPPRLSISTNPLLTTLSLAGHHR